ncbi:malonate decarboxylase holo-ACP synthase [Enterococcus sp. DIV0876]|uniref:malonate decarboxylase holo-ACP synthase n=1 Tax=Enterococcus sp. DIV0876 TaxID=2774633 RepID=UPI003D2FBC4B
MNRAHDIVLLEKEVLDTFDVPEWFQPSKVIYATVRRGIPTNPSYLPVGLRGTARAQRFGFEAPCNMIKRTIHPWDLIYKESFRKQAIADFPAYRQYREARSLLRDCNWGVGGSLGFELATQQPTVNESSDFDLLLYADEPARIPYTILRENHAFFDKLDTQVITPKGGFALKEYLRDPEKKILLKTDEGPKLTTELW